MLNINASLIGSIVGVFLLISEYSFYIHILLTKKRIANWKSKIIWIVSALAIYLSINTISAFFPSVYGFSNYGIFFWPFAYGFFIYKTQTNISSTEEE